MSATANRKRISQKTVATILQEFWEVDDGSSTPRGLMAMRYLYKNDPKEWLRFIGTYLPRELVIENSLQELFDDDFEDLIERMRAQVEAERARTIEHHEVVRIGSSASETAGREEPQGRREDEQGRADR
jgi:hypothetical protein